MPSQLDEWRSATPGCRNRIHLNNAGAALMPSSVLSTMVAHLTLESDIGGYEAATERADDINAVYHDLASLVNAAPRNMAVTASATAAFIQAITSFDFAPGDAVLTTRSDYTSYQIQFLSLSKRLGVRILYADDLTEGGVDPQSVRDILRRTPCRLVHVSWVPTHSGLVQDAMGVGAECAELGVPYLVDACQAVGQLPVDVRALQCDYLTATARKFLRGPRGVGFLYASDAAMARGDHPLFVDMRGATWVAPHRYDVAEGARRYEDWEFAYSQVLGMGAAVRYAMSVGIDVAHERSHALANHLRHRLRAIPGARVLDLGRDPCAIVTVAFAGHDARTLAAALSRRQINVTSSLRWYGLLDFSARDVETALRISPHYYNTREEVDVAVDALAELVGSKP